MYVRVKTTPLSPRKSVQIVKGIRIGNKVKQKIVRHVGIAINDFELKKLKDLANHIIAQMEAQHLRNDKQLSLFEPSEEEIYESIKRKKQGRRPKRRIEDIIPHMK